MSIIRRAILALALIAGLSPAFAQAPTPVPALPDTERRTAYSIAASTCACNVNFAIYGDGTDYTNWIEVFVNGTLMPQFGNWSLTSPSGPIATLARPITDAVLTFNAAQTGTVQIVGARRPRRLSQFSESGGVSARNLNQVFTDVIAMLRENWDKTNDVTGRAILAPPGETLSLLAAASARANSTLGFDALGNIALYSPASAVTSSANVNFLQAGTGAVSRTVQAELRDTIKAQQFGEVCDGVTDDAPAVQRAVTFADSIGGPTVMLCAGTTRWNSTPFLNKWTTPGTLTVPGLSIKGRGKGTTIVDNRTSGFAIAVNPDWKAAHKSLFGITPATGGSGALATNTYYVQITVNTPQGDEVVVTLAKSIAVVGPTGRIAITLEPLNSGYSYNLYCGTTSTPGNYCIVGGGNASAIGGNQSVNIDAIGSVRAIPGGKLAVWQQASVSDLSITSTTNVTGASGVSFFKVGYSNLTNVFITSLNGTGFELTNYTGDLDGSFMTRIANSKFDHIAGNCVDAGGNTLEMSNFTVDERTIFNICGTLPTNYVQPQNYGTSGFTISTLTNSTTPVVTTSVAHTLQKNDQVYIRAVTGMTLADGWYRACGTVASTTYQLCNLNGAFIDTTALGAYTANSGRSMLAWRPPTTTNGVTGCMVWMGLIGTFRNIDFTQCNNFSMYFTETGTSDNATLEGIDFENTYGKALYIAALSGGTLLNSECLTQIAFGPTISCVQMGTGFNAGGVQNFEIKNMKVRSDATPMTAFEQFQNTNNTSSFADTNRVTGATWQLFDAAGQKRFDGVTFSPIPAQVQFSISAANTAKLIPVGKGATLPVKLKGTGEWVAVKIPDAGVTGAVTGGLSANTQYNCFSYNTAATSAPVVVGFECSASARAFDNGYLIKSGSTERLYIGSATTDGSGNFQTTGAQSSQFPISAAAPIVINSNGDVTCPTCVLISGTAHGNSDYAIVSTDRYVYTNAAFTAPRTWTLPAANSLAVGTTIWVQDAQNTVGSTNTLTIARAGADTINISSASLVITGAGGGITFTTDGVSNWGVPVQTVSTGGTGRQTLTNHGVLVGAAANPVTQLTVGTNGQLMLGATGADPAFATMSQDCTITAAGVTTCTKTNNVSFGGYATISAGQIANSLGADVNLSATGTYFDGPSTAQGTTGTWMASGQVVLTGSAADSIFCKLWDGTTVIASSEVTVPTVAPMALSLSGFLATPAGNIRISCRDVSSTSGKMVFNSTGNSKDSTVAVFRIN